MIQIPPNNIKESNMENKKAQRLKSEINYNVALAQQDQQQISFLSRLFQRSNTRLAQSLPKIPEFNQVKQKAKPTGSIKEHSIKSYKAQPLNQDKLKNANIKAEDDKQSLSQIQSRQEADHQFCAKKTYLDKVEARLQKQISQISKNMAKQFALTDETIKANYTNQQATLKQILARLPKLADPNPISDHEEAQRPRLEESKQRSFEQIKPVHQQLLARNNTHVKLCVDGFLKELFPRTIKPPNKLGKLAAKKMGNQVQGKTITNTNRPKSNIGRGRSAVKLTNLNPTKLAKQPTIQIAQPVVQTDDSLDNQGASISHHQTTTPEKLQNFQK
eukprot:403340023